MTLREKTITTEQYGDVIIRELNAEDWYWLYQDCSENGKIKRREYVRRLILSGCFKDGKRLFGDDDEQKVKDISPRVDYAKLANAALAVNLADDPKEAS
jgi:hypothetical protein